MLTLSCIVFSYTDRLILPQGDPVGLVVNENGALITFELPLATVPTKLALKV